MRSVMLLCHCLCPLRPLLLIASGGAGTGTGTGTGAGTGAGASAGAGAVVGSEAASGQAPSHRPIQRVTELSQSRGRCCRHPQTGAFTTLSGGH